MKTINTVTGTTTAEKLGMTLMHEHLMVGWGGWELDCTAPRFERKAALKVATDRLKELRDLGLNTFLPMPDGYRARRGVHGRGRRRLRYSTGLYYRSV
jgi:phosphotriesterase-related protein